MSVAFRQESLGTDICHVLSCVDIMSLLLVPSQLPHSQRGALYSISTPISTIKPHGLLPCPLYKIRELERRRERREGEYDRNREGERDTETERQRERERERERESLREKERETSKR